MDLKKIRANLGRCKASYQKNDAVRALTECIMALTDIVRAGSPTLPLDVRGLIRESIQLLSRDPIIKDKIKAPIIYQPGQERATLIILADIYKQTLAEQENENREQSLARKQKLDQSLILGNKLLAQGKVSEADAAFQEAISAYKDEHRIFLLIGKALMDAEQPRRAYPYLKKAMEVEPDNNNLLDLYDQVQKARGMDTGAE